MSTVTATQSYLKWAAMETRTSWWHDSGIPDELAFAMDHGASGVTTNPLLILQAINSHPHCWRDRLRGLSPDLTPSERAEVLVQMVVTSAATTLEGIYECTGKQQGYVCAQLNPSLAADTKAMILMARRFSAWAHNVAVKFPVTAAGLDAMEECAAEGITVTATVSFTVPQAIAVAERYRLARQRAERSGTLPGNCFVTIMIGRLDDYLHEVARDRKAPVTELDLKQAGLAVTKRAYSIYQQRGYEAVLLVAALRGTYHMQELAGAKVIMSIHPTYQQMLLDPRLVRDERIGRPIDENTIRRLATIPEFVRAYEPDGMTPQEFLPYGASQRTLAQFMCSGWSMLETLNVAKYSH